MVVQVIHRPTSVTVTDPNATTLGTGTLNRDGVISRWTYVGAGSRIQTRKYSIP